MFLNRLRRFLYEPLCNELSENDFNVFKNDIFKVSQQNKMGGIGIKIILEKYFSSIFEKDTNTTTFYTWYFLSDLGFNVILVKNICKIEIFAVLDEMSNTVNIEFNNNKYFGLNRYHNISFNDAVYTYPNESSKFILGKNKISCGVPNYLPQEKINIKFEFSYNGNPVLSMVRKEIGVADLKTY